MTRTLFLSPHNDDETLFGSFLILRYRPRVMVTYRSLKQEADGITADMREAETECALAHLLRRDFEWSQSDLPDTVTSEASGVALAGKLDVYRGDFDHVFAPAYEDGGHDQHNTVARYADEVYGVDNVTHYLTYRRGYGKTTSEWEVPFEPDWPIYKLQALGCYRSQIALPATRPWFIDSTLREYLAHEPKLPAPAWQDDITVRTLVTPEHRERMNRL